MEDGKPLAWDELVRKWIGSELRDRSLIDGAILYASEKWHSDSQIVTLLREIRDDPYQKVSALTEPEVELNFAECQTLRICLRLREALASDVIPNASDADRPLLCSVIEDATDELLDAARELGDDLLKAAALRLSINAHFYRGNFEQGYLNALGAAKIYRDLMRKNDSGDDLIVSGYAFSLNRCANCLGGLGQAHSAQRFQALALKVYEELAERSGVDCSQDLAMTKHNLVNLLIDLDRFEEAQSFSVEVVETYRKLTSENRDLFLPNLAHSLVNYSKVLRFQGQGENSVICGREAAHYFCELAKEFPEVFGANLAVACHQLSLCYKNVGKIKAARRLSRQACKCFAHRQLDGRMVVDIDAANSFQQWAGCLVASGHYEKAIKVFEQAVVLYEEISKAGNLSILEAHALCLNEQSVLLFERGYLEDSIHPAQQSHDLYRRLYDAGVKGSEFDVAISTANLGVRHFRLGRPKEALRFSKESLGYYRKTGLGSDEVKLKYAGSLLNFATCLSVTGKTARALPPMTQSVEIARQITRKNSVEGLPKLGRILTNYTLRLRENNRIKMAIEVGEEAVSVYQTLAGEDAERFDPMLAAALNNLATCLVEAKRGDECLRTLDEAISVYERLNQSEVFQDLFLEERFQLCFNKSLYLLREGGGQYEEALETLRVANNLSMRFRSQFRSPSQRKRIQEDVLSSRHWHLLVSVSFWMKTRQPAYLDEAFQIADQIRGQGLDDLLSEEAYLESPETGLGKLEGRYFKTQRQLGEIENNLANEPTFAAITREMKTSPQSELRLSVPGEEEDDKPAQGSMAKIEELKREMNSLKDQIREHSPDWNPSKTRPPVAMAGVAATLHPRSAFLQLTMVKNGMLALIVFPKQETICVNIPNVDLASIREFSGQWSCMVMDLAKSEDDRATKTAKFQELLAKVSQLLPKQLKTMLLAIHGEVNRLVISPNGPLHLFPLHLCQLEPGSSLGDLFQISLTTSGSTYFHAQQRPRSPGTKIFFPAAKQKDLIFGQLESQILNRLFVDERANDPSTHVLNQVKENMAGSSVFSFSGHAFFDCNTPARSGLRLGNGMLTIGDFLEKPLLPNCKVAILNGCESGFLQPDATDDFVSLPAALIYSGAQAVISTLWSISDLSACFFGIKFHEALQTGATAQDAFQAAIAWLQGTGPHSCESKESFLGEVLPGYLKDIDGENLARKITGRAFELLCDIPDDQPPFAHPMHWAPYVLHGDARVIPFPHDESGGDDTGLGF